MGPDLIAIVPFAANCTGAWENILVAAQTTGFPSEGILAMSVLPFHDSTGTGTVTDFEVSNFTAGVVSRGGRDGSSAWFSRVDSKT